MKNKLFKSDERNIETILENAGLREYVQRDGRDSKSAYFAEAIQSQDYFALVVIDESMWGGIKGSMWDENQSVYLGHVPTHSVNKIRGDVLSTNAYRNELFELESLVQEKDIAHLKYKQGEDIFTETYKIQTKTYVVPEEEKTLHQLEKL